MSTIFKAIGEVIYLAIILASIIYGVKFIRCFEWNKNIKQVAQCMHIPYIEFTDRHTCKIKEVSND